MKFVCHVYKYAREMYNRTTYTFMHNTYKYLYATSINIDFTCIVCECHKQAYRHIFNVHVISINLV